MTNHEVSLLQRGDVVHDQDCRVIDINSGARPARSQTHWEAFGSRGSIVYRVTFHGDYHVPGGACRPVLRRVK